MKWIKAVIPFTTAALLAVCFHMSFGVHYLLTGSMSPAYPAGSIVVMGKFLEPEEGSVCSYRHNGMTVVHRIIEETDKGFIFQGDANNIADPYTVTYDDIEGRLIFGLPFINFNFKEN